jgi:hypothetical protein
VNKKVKSVVSKKEKSLGYVIVRCRDAGVHAGEYVKHSGREVVLKNARRIWYWDGAASLNQIAVSGCTRPENCKIAMPVEQMTLLEACEIIVCSKAGESFLREVVEWKR